jgi:hypothetical protein
MSIVNKILIILLLIYGNQILFAQTTLQGQFEKAVQLFNGSKYFDSITEFKRLLFFDREKKYSFQSNLYIGTAYKEGGKFDEAVHYFTIAEMNASNEQEIFDSKIWAVRANILRRSTDQAIKMLEQILSDSKFDSSNVEINYWKGWAYIFSDKWDLAAESFSKNPADSLLAKFCSDVDDEKFSESFAKYSSYLIPGLGQFYTGEYISGALSLGWNVLFGYLAIDSFADERVFDGFVTANFLWLRFYSGNLQNAEKFVTQKNLTITNDALRNLQTIYKGKKP